MIKNTTTNRTASELVDLIVKVRREKNDGLAAYAYATGVLTSLLDWQLKGYDNGLRTLQDHINDSYKTYEKELVDLSTIAA